MAGLRSRLSCATMALLLALLLGVAASPAAAADAISFSATGYVSGPVLAADGRVVIAERIAGAQRILAIDPRTHVVDELARFASRTGPRTYHELRLAGSGGIVTATLDTWQSPSPDDTSEQASSQASIVAARASTGEVLLRAPSVAGYELGSDGILASADRGDCSIRVVSLEPLAQRRVGLPNGLCPGILGNVAAVAGGRVVYSVLPGYGVTDLQGAAHLVGELPVQLLTQTQVAFDGRTLFGVRRRCHDELLLAVDATVPASAPVAQSLPPSLATCPVRRAGPGRLRVTAGRRVRVRVRCSAGCQGTLRLVEQRSAAGAASA